MRRRLIPYNPKLKQFARNLRNDSTPGEIILWKELSNKKIYGFDFHRQKPLLNYIVDFYCYELNLVIEIDGGYHTHEERYNLDILRENDLAAYNLTILRFTETEIKNDIFNVLGTIEMHIIKTHPCPSQEGSNL